MGNSMKGSTDLRRVNSLIHSDDEESVLAHFGVLDEEDLAALAEEDEGDDESE